MHGRGGFSRLPPADAVECAVAFCQTPGFGRHGIPGHKSRTAHGCEFRTDLVPVRALRRRLWCADPCEPRRIEHDHAFIRDLEVDSSLGQDCFRQGDDGLGKSPSVIDVRSVRLRDKLQLLAASLDGTPVQGGRNLQHRDLLRRGRIIPQSDLAAGSQPLLHRLDPDVQVVAGEGKRLAIEGKSISRTSTEEAEQAKMQTAQLHCPPEDASWLVCASLVCVRACPRLCRTISYITTAPATDTFSEDTFPSIGIETRKSHFFLTRSCRPLPSAPRTSAQSML